MNFKPLQVGDLVKVNHKYTGCHLLADDGLYDPKAEMTKEKIFMVLEVKNYTGTCKLISSTGDVGWSTYELLDNIT